MENYSLWNSDISHLLSQRGVQRLCRAWFSIALCEFRSTLRVYRGCASYWRANWFIHLGTKDIARRISHSDASHQNLQDGRQWRCWTERVWPWVGRWHRQCRFISRAFKCCVNWVEMLPFLQNLISCWLTNSMCHPSESTRKTIRSKDYCNMKTHSNCHTCSFPIELIMPSQLLTWHTGRLRLTTGKKLFVYPPNDRMLSHINAHTNCAFPVDEKWKGEWKLHRKTAKKQVDRIVPL